MTQFEKSIVLEEEKFLEKQTFDEAWGMLLYAKPNKISMWCKHWNNETARVTIKHSEEFKRLVAVITYPNGLCTPWHPSAADLFDREWVLEWVDA